MSTQWIVTEIDGKVASIATDYRHLARIGAEIAALDPAEVGSIGTRKISTEDLLEFARYLKWEDLRPFGTPFQLKVWKTLFDLPRKLYSYSEIAALAGVPQGVRPVAHVVAYNPTRNPWTRRWRYAPRQRALSSRAVTSTSLTA